MGPILAAAVQLPRGSELRSNFRQAQYEVMFAAQAGVQLVVLPELAFCPRRPSSVHEAGMCSQSAEGWQTRDMMALSRDLNVSIAFGFVEAANGSFYNSAVIVTPQGGIAVSRKRNLHGDDFFWASPGNSLPNAGVITNFGKVGLLVGADVANAARAGRSFVSDDERQFYDFGSVDVICVCTDEDTGLGFPATGWVDLASELACSVVVANRCPEDLDGTAGSCVIDPMMRVWTAGSHETDPCMVGGTVGTY